MLCDHLIERVTMSNRKATFAKRQRESDLKDAARQKEQRLAQRRSQPKTSKGPEIDWGAAVDTSNVVIDDVIATGPGAPDASGNPSATSDSRPSSPSAAPDSAPPKR